MARLAPTIGETVGTVGAAFILFGLIEITALVYSLAAGNLTQRQYRALAITGLRLYQ
jgi:hypothetical protein